MPPPNNLPVPLPQLESYDNGAYGELQADTNWLGGIGIQNVRMVSTGLADQRAAFLEQNLRTQEALRREYNVQREGKSKKDMLKDIKAEVQIKHKDDAPSEQDLTKKRRIIV